VAFVDEHRERFGVEPICRVLSEHGVKIAPNCYYAHKTRPVSTRAVPDERVLAEITRLMRVAGLQGARRGRRFTTTKPDPSAPRPPDLVQRDFTAGAPNRLWVVDFTYVPTWSGTVFTAFVSDAFSRRIVAWRTAAAMPTSLPLDALEMALWTRQREGHSDDGRLDGLVHHSDAGSQYVSLRYSERLADAGALASIGSVGDSYDNAQIESLIGLLQARVRPSRRTLARCR
jgi:putative transposase